MMNEGGWRHCDVFISIVLSFSINLFVMLGLYANFCQLDNTHFVGHVISNCNKNVREI